MRRMVLSASGRTDRRPYCSHISLELAKMDGHGKDQSMISAAVRQGNSLPDNTSGLSGAPCVGFGQTMGSLSRRAIRNSRLRVVGVP